MTARVIYRVEIRGRVQGVGYRAWLHHTALAMSLVGWVRNRRDGSVEAVLAGPEDVVLDMITQCDRGPALARVETVTPSAAGADALNQRRAGEAFSVLPTL